jgi:hypothetical protein
MMDHAWFSFSLLIFTGGFTLTQFPAKVLNSHRLGNKGHLGFTFGLTAFKNTISISASLHSFNGKENLLRKGLLPINQ